MTGPMNPLQSDLRAEADYRRQRLTEDFRRAGGRSRHGGGLRFGWPPLKHRDGGH